MRYWDVASVVERLPTVCKTLGLVPRTTQAQNIYKENELQQQNHTRELLCRQPCMMLAIPSWGKGQLQNSTPWPQNLSHGKKRKGQT